MLAFSELRGFTADMESSIVMAYGREHKGLLLGYQALAAANSRPQAEIADRRRCKSVTLQVSKLLTHWRKSCVQES